MLGALQTLGRRRLAILLLPVATVAVHQLRYLLAYGPDAGRVLIAQGDAYVESLIPGLILLLGVCVGGALLHLWRVARGCASARPARAVSVRQLWAFASIALLAAYLGQEALEVLLGSAHASFLAQAFGDGGWWAGPAALIVALGWALLARGARAVLEFAARRATRRRWPDDGPLALERPRRAAVLAPRPCPLSHRQAGRAPPLRPAIVRL
jgi:hypothetical protein